ncbi:MAG: phage tail sheath subtilisin-like domain-containing protein [Pseudodesulfovibrio sp.]|nr:phage tail sheath subtilisin-like domain-containing protein [Pseudodesulfovibrio sp.]
MSVSFDLIPVNLRIPGVFAEFDSSNAMQGLPIMPVKGLIVGQRLAAGSKSALDFTRVTNVEDAKAYYGAGSMLALMYETWHKNNSFTECICVALDDDGDGVLAAWDVTFTGAATAPGIVTIYVGGKLVRTGVSIGDDAAAVATALVADITAETDLPVTAAAVAGVVTLTAKNKGEAGNGIDIRFNYYDGDVFPSGIAGTVAVKIAGAGNPILDDMIAAMGDEWYNFIALPYTDAVSLTAMEAELDRRWGPMHPFDGRAFAVCRGTHSELGTFGDSRNSAHVCCMHGHGVPTSTFEMAAALAAEAAYHGAIDPARPFTTLELKGVLPPKKEDRFSMEERNLLLFDGISTFTVDAGGKMRIEKLITMYKKSDGGAEDSSYLYVNTLLTLSYLRFSLRNRFLLKFPRHKLADDGTRFGAGQKIVTPKVAKAEILALFRDWELSGLVENVDQFKADLIVERDASNRNRLNMLIPPDLINQADIFAGQFQFIW